MGMMRVFKLNDSDAYCGRNAREAIRAAMRDSGLPFREIVDKWHFEEVLPDAWPGYLLRDLEDQALNVKMTLADVMADVTEPQMVFTSNW